jgi:hypothetical protein
MEDISPAVSKLLFIAETQAALLVALDAEIV